MPCAAGGPSGSCSLCGCVRLPPAAWQLIMRPCGSSQQGGGQGGGGWRISVHVDGVGAPGGSNSLLTPSFAGCAVSVASRRPLCFSRVRQLSKLLVAPARLRRSVPHSLLPQFIPRCFVPFQRRCVLSVHVGRHSIVAVTCVCLPAGSSLRRFRSVEVRGLGRDHSFQ